MKFLCTWGITLLLSCLPLAVTAQGYLHAEGKSIVDGNGDPYLLRGMGLGGWMLQEGYMLQTAGFANAQHEIREKIEELIGPADTELFYDAWRSNHVRRADIDSLKAWGFNSVRLPMHYNLFTLPIEDEPVAGEQSWLQLGFDMTDSLIAWCADNQMYVILDLHAAPGGQGMDAAISDYDPDKPSLWESQANRDKTVALWKRLAARYANEPWVGGYDLINETNWNMTGNTPLRDLYWEITDSIRTVDNNHIIFIEGNWWANDFTGLTPPWDSNMVYSPHKYWSINDQNSIQWVLDIRETYNVPLYLGESGENSNVWFRDAIRLLEDNDIGWAWWPMKKIESIAGPYSVAITPGYQALLDYWGGNGPQPTATAARNALMGIADDLKLENCDFHPDVIDAMFRQVYSDETRPYNVQSIPGEVLITDFDMGVVGEAYFDVEVANYQVSTGNYSSWNNGWVYRNDGVDLEISQDPQNSNGIHAGWLDKGEWMQYSVDVAAEAVYDVEIRLASISTEGQFHLQAGTADLMTPVTAPNTGDWQTWQTVTIPNVILGPDDEKLRFFVDNSGFNAGHMEFIQKGPTTDLATSFVSAFTLDDQTVQLNLNKPLDGPLPASPASFQLFVNGSSVTITSANLPTSNPRTVIFGVSTAFKSSDDIRISYSGSQIKATDGTNLQSFSQKIVQNNVAIIHAVPGKVQAEDFFDQSGIQLESTTDTGGGDNIGFLDNGDFADYYINVDQAGLYNVDYRTAAESETGAVKMELISPTGQISQLHTASFPSTGGWQTWTTTRETLILPAGLSHIRMTITAPLFNINWMDFTFESASSIDPARAIPTFSVFPNPSQEQFHIRASLDQPQAYSLQVLDVMGRNVFVREFAPSGEVDFQLTPASWPAGPYLIQLRLENGLTAIQKVLWQAK